MKETAALLAAAGVLMLLAVGVGRLGSRMGVPALLVFLGVGMLAGEDGIGGISFDDPQLAQDIGVVALVLILFAGGLASDTRVLRSVAAPSLLLSTVGVVVTAAVVGVAAVAVFEVSLYSGLLLGAIVASTDAAAVFAVLRAQRLGLRNNLRQVLEIESGTNDPMAVILTLGMLELIEEPDRSPLLFAAFVVQQLVIGAAVGVAAGAGALWILNRARLDHDGLYPAITIAVAVATYGVASVMHGSGFLAVYLAALVLASRPFRHERSLLRFHDGVAWLSQIGMFLALGLLVFPSRLPDIAGRALVIAAVLVLVARPLATAITLLPLRVPWRDAAFVSWVGLRGAVPIILATFPLVEGIPEADVLFDVVFFVVLVSILAQGTTIRWVARRLGVTAPYHPDRAQPIEATGPLGDAGADLHHVTVQPGAAATGRPLMELGLPEGVLVVLVERGEDHLVPTGATVLEPDDVALVLANPEELDLVRSLLSASGDGHQGP